MVVAFVSMYAFGGVSNALYSETSEQTKPTGAASSDLANADQPKREAEEAPREVESTKEEVAQKDAEGKDTGEVAKSSDGEAKPVKEEPDSDSDTGPAQKPGADGEGNASSGQAPPAKSPPPTAEEQLYAKIAGGFLLVGKPVKEMAEHVKGQEFKPSQAEEWGAHRVGPRPAAGARRLGGTVPGLRVSMNRRARDGPGYEAIGASLSEP